MSDDFGHVSYNNTQDDCIGNSNWGGYLHFTIIRAVIEDILLFIGSFGSFPLSQLNPGIFRKCDDLLIPISVP